MPTLRVAAAANQIVAMAARPRLGPKSSGYSQDELFSASRRFAHRFSIAPGCLAGATPLRELEPFLAQAGFSEIKIEPKDESREFIKDWAPDRKLEGFVTSALIQAAKR
jgi:hypothetical protein